MQIVIEIDDEIYKKIHNGEFWLSCGLNLSNAYDSIKNGTPLPKGHGRLADIDAAISKIDELMKDGNFDIRDSTILRATRIWFNNIPTVLEADKESAE